MSVSVSNGQGSPSASTSPSADDAARQQASDLFQQMLGQAADPGTLAAERQALAGGASLQDVRQLVAHSGTATTAINGFYRDVLGVDADPAAQANVQKALGAGQSLAQAEAGLRPQFAHSATAAAGIQALYQGVAGRQASSGELATSEDALAAGQSLDQMRAVLLNSSTASVPARQVDALYQQVLGRDADLGGLASGEAALAGGASPDQLRSGLAHSAEAGQDLNVFYQEVLGRDADAAGLAHWDDQLATGEALGDVRLDIAHSPEALAQVQAVYTQQLGRAATASEVDGFQMAKWSAAPGAAFTVGAVAGASPAAPVNAGALVAGLGADVAQAGGLTPTLTTADGQVLRFRNATELAGFALSAAERSGQASPALLQGYGQTVASLEQSGQADLQASANLLAMEQAAGAAGNTQEVLLDDVGAQLAKQIQATPAGQRHALTQRVALDGQYAADVTVTGDAGDGRGLAGFSTAIIDTDPGRTQLVADSQSQAVQAEADKGNPLLSFLDGAQARVDAALAALPAGGRSDKMLGVAQQFVDAGRGAVAADNWNLVQTLETAADVSLQEAAQPKDSRTKLTERFMHKEVKHDITVDPNSADPFASFSDHSKGNDDIGAIVEQMVGIVADVLSFVPGVNAVAIPVAVAVSTAEAGQDLANGNILGGALALAGAAAGGVGQYAQAVGAAAEAGSATAQAASDVMTAAQNVSRGVAALQGLQGVVTGAEHGDVLAALTSAAGGLAGSVFAGTDVGKVLAVGSAVAGGAVAAAGGNWMQALAATETAAAGAGLFGASPLDGASRNTAGGERVVGLIDPPEQSQYRAVQSQYHDLVILAKTPNSGDPNTWFVNPGSGQMRLFDPSGNPALDLDFDHSHNGIKPHMHIWLDGTRGEGIAIPNGF